MSASPVHVGGTLGDVIISALNRYPDRIAFVCDGRSYRYREVRQQVSRAVQALRALGLGKGDSLVQLTRNLPEQWFVMAAAYLLGLKSVTLHAMGSIDDHAFVIDDAAAAAVIVDGHFESRAQELRARCPAVTRWFCHGDSATLAPFWLAAGAFEPAPLVDETGPEDIVRIAYTGGTTGRPKGVLLSSRSMLFQALLSLIEKDWPDDPIFLCAAPISHGAGANIIPTLSRGGTFVMMPGFNVERVLEAIEQHRASVLYVVPTMLYGLLDHPRTRAADLSSLRSIMYGASPAFPTRIREAIDVFGPILCQTYGQTEAPSSITVLRKCDHDRDDLKRLSSCGLPYPGIQVDVLDQDCAPVEQGSIGEICVRGPIVMSGYWKQPDLTAEAFRGGWLHTGDMAYRDEAGFYYIVDRKKDMIITGGFNVYPREVEDVLAAHPDVAAAAVIGVPDAKWGEAVKAVIVPRAGAQPSAEDLIALVREKKGPVNAPKSVEFVAALPLTAVGKPDKAALRRAHGVGEGHVG